MHTADELRALLAATDPATVGLALDTAELTVGGIDPVAFYRENAERVTHVHLKDTRYADTGEEYRMPGAESTMLKGGAGRRIERWFYELGTEGGLVDVKGFVAALRERDFRGWVVVESDHGGNPAELAMLNSWYLQHVSWWSPDARAGTAHQVVVHGPLAQQRGRGPIDQWHSVKTMSAFLKQIKATGFDAIDTFDFRIWQMYGDYGGPAKYQEMVQDHGLERIVNTFHAADYDVRNYAPHLPETHENILEDFRVTMGRWSQIRAGQHHRHAGDALLRHGADHRGQAQVRRRVLEQGRRDHRRVRRPAHVSPRVLLRHPERTRHRDLLLLHRSAVRVAVRRHRPALHRGRRPGRPCTGGTPHRVSGFHFKDTRNVATGDDHRHRPDSEIMAPTTGKWFYEMGTPQGLVDFEAMMTAVRDNGYTGWISVEHDKANKEGGDYSESTASPAGTRRTSSRRSTGRGRDDGISWAYAIDPWKPQFDDFVRREQHERALKTISIAGFEGVELTAGTGRWEPLGNPQQLAANFGSLAGFRAFLDGCGIAAVSSWLYDPQQRSMEHLTPALSPLVPDDVPLIVEQAVWFADALAELGGSVLAVRAAPSAGDVDALDDDALDRLAACWSAVGRVTRERGVTDSSAGRLPLRAAPIPGPRRPARPDRSGRGRPRRRHRRADRRGARPGGRRPPARAAIRHVRLKDALATDAAEEYLQPTRCTRCGSAGERENPRWFAEPGADGGLVDVLAVTRALVEIGYAGWVVVDSGPSPHPATSALLGGYLLQRDLAFART